MDHYFLHGKLTAKEGSAPQLQDILLRSAQLVAKAPGCKLYVIGQDAVNPNDVWITEIWDSKETHDDALKLDGIPELIQQAIPLLEGQPQKGQELRLIGGAGI